ncbi:IS110 family transposase [Escherichia coli]|uniref:IS110 family transposase n=1 Tax=Escherichia coli TaxID=562 RepID=UPI000DA4BEBF|nr:IS110 family transposase [Escherichia coli]SQL84128.1 transposase [Escherichia coli]SQS27651.1 transposase [Escherichia coli]
MTESSDYESVQVFIGVDVGKDTHHAVAINRSGKRLFDKALPNDENKLRSLIPHRGRLPRLRLCCTSRCLCWPCAGNSAIRLVNTR